MPQRRTEAIQSGGPDASRVPRGTGAPLQFRTWQIDMLRDGLRAYHALGDLKGAGRYNWNDVMEAIAEYTGVAIPAETLRQFAERFRDPRRGGMRSLQRDRLAAVYEFLIDKEVRIFTPDEFAEAGFDPNFVLQFRNTLRRRYDQESAEYFERLGPYWRALRRGIHSMCVLTTLQFEEIGENQGTFYVTEREDTFPDSLIEKLTTGALGNLPDPALQQFLAGSRDQKRVSQGYAVITPEGTLFIFLKDRRSTNNQYYVSLFRNTADGVPAEDTLAGALQRFDYEVELTTGGQRDPRFMAQEVLEHFTRNILLFCPSPEQTVRRFPAPYVTPDALAALSLEPALPPAPDVAIAIEPDPVGQAWESFARRAANLTRSAAGWIGNAVAIVKRIPSALAAAHRQQEAAATPEVMSMTAQEEDAHAPSAAAGDYLDRLAEETFRQCQGRFMEAAAAGSCSELTQAIRDADFRTVPLDVNARHPDSGETALHGFAAAGSRQALREIFRYSATRDLAINHLLRDKQGRLPSKMASLYGEDPVIARYLLAKEKQAARKLGLDLHWVEPEPEAWNRRVHTPSRYRIHQ